MHLKLSIVMLFALSLCAAAAAQVDNCCLVDRQCHSDKDWVDGFYAYQSGQCAASAQSQPGTSAQTGASSQIDNCCFAGWQCNNDLDWINGYHAYQNGQCAAPAPAQPQVSTQSASGAPAQIDNCCFAGWQCNTDQDWINGYHAFQNGQCASPAQSQPHAAAPSASIAPAQIDNCCFAGWPCINDQEWNNGYHAYRNNDCVGNPRIPSGASCCQMGWNCALPSDRIMGVWFIQEGWQCSVPAQANYAGSNHRRVQRSFIARVTEALDLLKSRAPEWYAYVITGPLKIREWLGSHALERSFNLASSHAAQDVVRRSLEPFCMKAAMYRDGVSGCSDTKMTSSSVPRRTYASWS